jgi:hypothetical protein
MARSACYRLVLLVGASRPPTARKRAINDFKRARAGCGHQPVGRTSSREKLNPGHRSERRAREPLSEAPTGPQNKKAGSEEPAKWSILSRAHSHSMASVLPSRHSSYTQFSASTRNACRRMTRCRVSSASGTKAGTTSKTFFKLRALSFCFCPKVRGGSPLEARWRRKRPF